MAPGTVAYGVAAIEHDAPDAGRLLPPDRAETRDELSTRVPHRPRRERERSGIQHLHAVGLPGERRRGALEEPRPALGHLALAPQRLLAREEDRLLGKEAREARGIA